MSSQTVMRVFAFNKKNKIHFLVENVPTICGLFEFVARIE